MVMVYILKILPAISLTFFWGCGGKSGLDSKNQPEPPSTENSGSKQLLSPSLPSTPPQEGDAVEAIPVDLGSLNHIETLIKKFNLKPYHRKGYFGQNIKIGIFDNGFAGLKNSRGRRLPPELTIEKSKDPRMQPSSHGTKMAEIIYGITTGSAEYHSLRASPDLYLFNTNGFSNLQAAVDRAIDLKLDMILYAQVWEFGGQFDGDGFINQEVNRALDAGILWINASGNGGASTYSGPLQTKVGHWVEFTPKSERLTFVVPQNETPTKIVLSWSDFKDSKNHKTEIDLDLILEDAQGQVIQESRLNQTGANEYTPGYSAHARETLETTLNSGIYSIGVHYKSNRMLKEGAIDERNRFRVTVVGNGIKMPHGTPTDSLPIPADNQKVIAVGALDTDDSGRWKPTGSYAHLREKPDLWLESEVVFSDPNEPDHRFQTQTHYGTSAASALTTGLLAVYMSAWGPLSHQNVLERCRTGVFNCKGFSLPDLP